MASTRAHRSAAAPASALRISLVLATSTGGVGRHLASLATGLSRLGQHVTVFGPPATDIDFGFSSAGAPDGEPVGFRAADIASGIRPLVALRAARVLRRGARDFDVMHAHGLRAGVIALAALAALPSRRFSKARVRRPAFVVTFHNSLPAKGFRRWLGRRIQRWVAWSADQVLVVSPDLRDGLGSRRVDVGRALIASVLPAPTRAVSVVRASLGVPDGACLVLAVGRLHAQKGFDVLVESAGILRGRRDVVVLIAGEGPQRPALERLIGDSGADVRLLGDRGDVADLVHAADVVVMSSRWEGWPLAAAEVLAAGRPLVATRVGGLPELVADAAVLVGAENAEELATAIDELLEDSRRAAELAAKALARAAQLPSPDDVTAQVLACYRAVLAPKA